MIDTVLNLLFRCPHRRLTRPVTPVGKAGEPQGGAYVACLDCGKQFAYDTSQMKIGRPLETARGGEVLHPAVVRPRAAKKVGMALLASLPVAMLLGSFLKQKKRSDESEGARSSRP